MNRHVRESREEERREGLEFFPWLVTELGGSRCRKGGSPSIILRGKEEVSLKVSLPHVVITGGQGEGCAEDS